MTIRFLENSIYNNTKYLLLSIRWKTTSTIRSCRFSLVDGNYNGTNSQQDDYWFVQQRRHFGLKDLSQCKKKPLRAFFLLYKLGTQVTQLKALKT
jgi:hypothetical protein